MKLNRRDFLGVALAQGAVLVAGCDSDVVDLLGNPPDAATLLARPGGPTQSVLPGFYPLGLGGARDGFFYVPPGYTPGQAAPLLVLLHGAGGSASDFKNLPIPALVDAAGVVVLCPDSRQGTWDLSLGGFGADVRFIDSALTLVFRRSMIDPARIALGGFSNGASYALSLGVYNGDLFTALVAFSPGFYTPPGKRGLPRIYASHGTNDPLLSNSTSPQIVPRLRAEGYSVTYRLFDGGHELPFTVAQEGVQWFVANL